jgi:hypothetical protein
VSEQCGPRDQRGRRHSTPCVSLEPTRTRSSRPARESARPARRRHAFGVSSAQGDATTVQRGRGAGSIPLQAAGPARGLASRFAPVAPRDR